MRTLASVFIATGLAASLGCGGKPAPAPKPAPPTTTSAPETPDATTTAPAVDAGAPATTDVTAATSDATAAPASAPLIPAEVASAAPEAGAVPQKGALRLGSVRPVAVAHLEHLAVSPDGRLIATVVRTDTEVGLWDATSGARLGTLTVSKPDGDAVQAVAFAPDGKTLAAVAGLAVTTWDTASLKETGRWTPKVKADKDALPFFRGVAWAPDGKTLAVGHNGGAVALVDAASGKVVKILSGRRTAFEHVAFSPDGALVAATGYGGEIRVWDVKSGKPALNFSVHDDGYGVGLAWVGAGELEALTSAGSVFSWSAAVDGGSVTSIGAVAFAVGAEQRFELLTDGTLAVAEADWTPRPIVGLGAAALDTRALAVGGAVLAVGDDLGVRVFDVSSAPTERWPARGHVARVDAVAWSADGTAVVSGGEDGTARVWSPQSGREAFRVTVAEPAVRGVALTSDGLVLVASGPVDHDAKPVDGKPSGHLRLARASGEVVAEHGLPSAPYALALAPDGRRAAVATWDGAVAIVGLPGLEVLATLGHDGPVAALAWRGADGLLAATGTDIAIWGLGPEAKVLGRRHAQGTRDAMLALALGSDGATLLTGGYTYGAVSRWDLGKPAEDEPVDRRGVDGADAPETIVRALAFLGDGRYVAGGSDGARVMKLGEDAPRERMAIHQGEVTAIAVAPDGKRVATGSADHTVLVWTPN